MNDKTRSVMFSSTTDDWATPLDFFKKLDSEFRFTLDACASDKNAKCKKFFTKEQDGLKQPWEGVVFCNPPYGRCVINKWVLKACEESAKGVVVVMLLPARTDTKWFHDLIYGKFEVRFVKGRLKFGGGKNSAPFPSMVVVFGNSIKEDLNR